MNPKVSLIILNWNAKNDTIECLSSLKKATYPNLEIIVVDNGSTDGSCETISTLFPNIILLSQNKNLGFAGGCNIGMRYALNHNADFLFLLNNDTTVDPLCISHMVNLFIKDPSIGILGAKLLQYHKPSYLDHIGGKWNPSKGCFDLIGLNEPMDTFSWNPSQSLDYVCGAAMMIKKEVCQTIGLLEDDFFLIWEESDFCMRAKKQGFSIHPCLSAVVWHKVSASFISKSHSTYFWWRNRLLWIERNCNKKEKRDLYKAVLNKEIFRIKKLRWIKSIEIFVLSKILKKAIPLNKKQKLHRYQAAYQGIQDFRDRRFGQGPNWIYQNLIK